MGRRHARAALSNWSSVPNGHIRFVEGTPADITISFVNSLSGECTVARGDFPAAGVPGLTVQISRVYAGSYSYAKQVWIMTHELGHNIGLGHTDLGFGTLVPNTPPSDPASVMNSGGFFGGCQPIIQAPDWAGLSTYDQAAVRYLYPLPKPVLSVTNVGGTPRVNWSALSGATSYSVVFYVNWLYSNKATGEHGNTEDPYPLGSTTGTSWLDTGRSYTGATFCDWSYGLETSRESYKYHVTAHFTTGTSFAFINAPVGEC